MAKFKKFLPWILLILGIAWVVNNPSGAANVVKSVFGTLIDIAEGFGDFFSSLAS
ncbi:MAG TPA: hypothetical protein VLA77_02280 [Candidatus Saccharimonadales bacterium]|nr:hypothetical protein [Candidatus Saccharimonadales bacterium]